MALNIKSRWAAFAIHLIISIVILLVLLAVIFFFWFPRDLIFAGGIDGLKILLGVDLVLGPLLTLLVYNHQKKELKWDLTIIGLIQGGCLIAGLWLIFNERPLIQVLADDGVHLLAASDFKYYEVTPKELPGSNPKFVLLDLPENRAEIGSIKFTSEFVDEKPFAFREDLYLPITEVAENAFRSRIQFIQELMSSDELTGLQQLMAAQGQRSCDWVPVYSKHVEGHACVSFDEGIVRLSDREF